VHCATKVWHQREPDTSNLRFAVFIARPYDDPRLEYEFQLIDCLDLSYGYLRFVDPDFDVGRPLHEDRLWAVYGL
jgi:hypothetical protein